MSVFLKEVKGILASHEIPTARVGCINAVSCTKAFKFTKVYDALLIHPTNLNVEGRIMTLL